MEKADNQTTKMTSVGLNNADEIKEKANFLKDQKIKNVNNFMQQILFTILSLLTLVASAATSIEFNEGIVENLILKNNTKAMEWWVDPPIPTLLKIHIFNYTNIDDVLSGREKKIKVEDIGPYVYKEFVSRVNLAFTDDNKITFNVNKTLVFMPELSGGLSESDLIRVPNIPFLAAITRAESLSVITKMAFNTVLRFTSPKEFHTKTVDEFLFGYTDSFTTVGNMAKENVGLLASRRGISTDNMTVHTGEDTLDNLGKIHAVNGETKMNIWDSDACNEYDGTDGSQFPPYMMDKDEELKIFIKSFCRSIKLKFEREVSVLNGIPAWRYKIPMGGFDTRLKNEDNKCYCDAANESLHCPPDGVFDVSKCADGIPLLLSYPHFMEGDSSLFTHFEGLKPDRKKHETYADIHQRMAFPIGGASRLQMNIRVKSKKINVFSSEISWFTKLPESLILPVFWYEVTLGEIPPEFQKIFFNATQSANATELELDALSSIELPSATRTYKDN